MNIKIQDFDTKLVALGAKDSELVHFSVKRGRASLVASAFRLKKMKFNLVQTI